MKYSVGQKVKIRSLEWCRDYVNRYGIIEFGKYEFFEPMNEYCGKVVTIKRIDDDNYRIDADKGVFCWTDEMIEGLVEEENQPKFKKGDCVKCTDGSCGIIVTCDWSNSLNCYQYFIDYIGTLDAGYQAEKDLQLHTITTMNGKDIFESAKWKHEFECPDGYIFKDENGNVINATKIVLEKERDDKLKLESTKKVREYWSKYTRIFIEIYDDNPNVCILTHLYTLEKYRQKGYARVALAEAELIAKELGCHTAYLKVETNSWMYRWYLRCGYNWNKNADEGYTWLTKNL